jgi:flagellar basal body L-ring protein FlgH
VSRRAIVASFGALGALLLVCAPLRAQAKTAKPPKNAKGAPKDTVVVPPAPVGRLSWTSDRRPLRVGDLLTVVVDESTVANESSTTQAHLTRSQNGTLNTDLAPAKLKSVGIGYGAQSDAGSTAGRSGDLTSIVSVRVTSIEPGGIAHVSGDKTVTVDGRKQQVRLVGVVRAEDIAADNTVASSRVADAVISYQGKKIGPTTGIIGKFLSILWP